MARELEQKMDELARKYTATRDPEIREEIYRLGREPEKTEKE
jgi:hypothetical protein